MFVETIFYFLSCIVLLWCPPLHPPPLCLLLYLIVIFLSFYLSGLCVSSYESPAADELVKQPDEEINQDSASYYYLFAGVCVSDTGDNL